MQTQITSYEKRDFIKQFLDIYELKQREAGWILTYLMKDEALLKDIYFVKEAKYCPRAMILSTTCSDQVPFLFYKGQIITDNPDKLFHDIRLHTEEALYVQLNTGERYPAYFHTSVLDDNPYVPNYWKLISQDQENSDKLLNNLQNDAQKRFLEIQIDAALAEGNKHEFLKLVKLFKQF